MQGKDTAHALHASTPPGTLVSVPTLIWRALPVEHVGLYAGSESEGQARIIHASRHYGAVVETSLAGFLHAARGPFRLLGYPSALDPEIVLARARALLGRPYDWRTSNCEHVVREAHGLLRRSPQWDAYRRLFLRDHPWGL